LQYIPPAEVFMIETAPRAHQASSVNRAAQKPGSSAGGARRSQVTGTVCGSQRNARSAEAGLERGRRAQEPGTSAGGGSQRKSRSAEAGL